MDTLFVSMCDTTESYIQWLDLATPYIASYVVQQLPCISPFCVDAKRCHRSSTYHHCHYRHAADHPIRLHMLTYISSRATLQPVCRDDRILPSNS